MNSTQAQGAIEYLLQYPQNHSTESERPVFSQMGSMLHRTSNGLQVRKNRQSIRMQCKSVFLPTRKLQTIRLLLKCMRHTIGVTYRCHTAHSQDTFYCRHTDVYRPRGGDERILAAN